MSKNIIFDFRFDPVLIIFGVVFQFGNLLNVIKMFDGEFKEIKKLEF